MRRGERSELAGATTGPKGSAGRSVWLGRPNARETELAESTRQVVPGAEGVRPE